MSETAKIAEVANKVTKDIFSWFKWEEIPIYDQNFKCHKIEKHKLGVKGKHKSHTHPVDVVFKYFDPYLNHYILLNTDLKCYRKSSIKTDEIRKALISLAKTIDCASGSSEWQKKYIIKDIDWEVRGLLFIYNHDNEYDKNFSSHMDSISAEALPIPEDAYIHILDPKRIVYLFTVVNDMMRLVADDQLPKNDYSFFYPDLLLHKRHGDIDKLPATIESLCSPYVIIKHGPPEYYCHEENQKKTGLGGYVIYYNESGSTKEEFKYLFDILSGLQILGGRETIKIRLAHHQPDDMVVSHYKAAIQSYVDDWGYDQYKKMDLDRIDFEVVNRTIPNYKPGILAWRIEE